MKWLEISSIHTAIQRQSGDIRALVKTNYEQEQKIKQLMDQIDVGADTAFKYDRSWAVVCLKGKKRDYVRFMELPEKDILSISNWVRNMEKATGRKPVFDAPMEFISSNKWNRG